MGGQPGNDVSYFSRRHRSIRRAMPPIGVAKIRSPGNDRRAQILIGDKRQK